MLKLITLLSCAVIVFSITSYQGGESYRKIITVLAYLLAFIVGAHGIRVLLGAEPLTLYSTAITAFIAISTLRKGGNIACFFKGDH